MAKRRHKKKRPMPVVRIGERATPERRRQLGGVVTEVVDRDSSGKAYIKRHRVRIECMLDYYFNKWRISDSQLMAGLKFREVFTRVHFGHNIKVLCQPFMMDGTQADPEWKLLAHMSCLKELDEAMALLSSAQKRVLQNVCGYDEAAGSKDNMATLLRGLDILAKHWGYV